METIEVKEKELRAAMFQFVFPFSISSGQEREVDSFLKEQGFERFNLGKLDAQSLYYGDYKVSHLEIEQYFLPFTNGILFPHSDKESGFHRHSKKLGLSCCMDADGASIPFAIHSVDITLCPYQLGILTFRAELTEPAEFSLANEFAGRFRVLDKKTTVKKTKISCDGGKGEYEDLETFVFNYLVPGLSKFFNRQNKKDSYFESLPFFEDEKMYVQSLIRFGADDGFGQVEAYRAVNLDGLTQDGNPYLSANNMGFIEKFVMDNSYERWAPNTLYVMEEHCFSCLTDEGEEMFRQLASQFYGKYYYAFILNLFHKIVLLKLANEYSELNVEKDKDKIEKLIHSINSFTSNYFFLELAAQSQSRQIFVQLRKMFLIDDLYRDARQTLMTLYKYDEKFSSQKSNLLLLILTLYTVVGGIYGMNQVIEDLKGNVDWSKMLSYSIFEYIALFTAFSGIAIAFYLALQNLIKWRKDSRKREEWISETSLSSRD